MLTALIGLAGIGALFFLVRESFPPVDFAKVTITTIYPGSSSSEVEEKITIPIENQLRNIEGVKDIKSTSQNERSKIEVRIDIDDPDVVTKDVVTEIQRAVDRVQNLPPDILERPQILEINAKEIPILEIAVVGPSQGRERDRWVKKLQRRLEDLKEIANVRLVGYREKEYQVLLDPNKLQQFYIGIPEIRQAVAARTSDTPAGYIKKDDKNQMVRIKAKVASAEELGEVPIRTGDSTRPIRIKDIGKAVEVPEEAKVLTALDGQDATLMVIVKKASADAIKTVEKIKKLLSDFEKELPPEYKIKIYSDESSRIQRRIDIVSSNAVQGLILVLVITFLFLPGRLSFFISLSLPISLLGTFYFMNTLGANFNLVTMLGIIIALGMLVDNSVVVGEIYAALIKDPKQNPQEAAIQSGYRFWVALLCSVLTTVAAFTPMLVTKGVMGQFIRWIPIVVNIALALSLVDSFLLLPARIQFMKAQVQKAAQSWQDRWFAPVEALFSRSLGLFLEHRWLTLLGFVILFIGSFIITLVGNRFELFPKEGVELYVARLEMETQTRVEETLAELKRLSQEVIATLGPDQVEAVTARAGIQSLGNDPLEKNDEHYGMLTIKIPPQVAEKQKFTEVLKKLESIPKGKATKLTFEPVGNGPPVGKPLNLVLRSDNEKELAQVVSHITQALEKMPGVLNLETDQTPSGPELVVLPKSEALNYVKLTEQDLGTNLRAAYQGLIVTKFYDQGDDFVLRIRFDEPFRKSLKSLSEIKVLNQRNLLIPLSPLAEVKVQEGPPVLKRYDFKRAITLTAEVDPKLLTSVALNKKAADMLQKLRKQYPSVTGVFGGEAESTKESVQSLFLALGLAVFGIIAILVFAFNSFAKPLIVLTSIPLGLIGINLAFFLHQRPLSFLALIGTIGLAGVIVNSAIILVSALDEYFQEQPEALASKQSYLKVVNKVATERLKPVLITSLTTIAGLFPTAYGIGGYDATLVPLTLAMGWGLLVGTFLSLVLIPTLYTLGYRKKG